jgi:hypothetical protein
VFNDVAVCLWDVGSENGSLPDAALAECWGMLYVIDGSDGKRCFEGQTAVTNVRENAMMTGKPIAVLYNRTSSASFNRPIDDEEVRSYVIDPVKHGKNHHCDPELKKAMEYLVEELSGPVGDTIEIKVEADMQLVGKKKPARKVPRAVQIWPEESVV